MALSENPTVEELKDLAEQYADMDFTRQDSLDAGNCEGGTDDFIEEYLDGNTTFKVRDLIPYIEENSGVRSALAYKFRQLEGQSAESAETESEDTSEDNPPF